MVSIKSTSSEMIEELFQEFSHTAGCALVWFHLAQSNQLLLSSLCSTQLDI